MSRRTGRREEQLAAKGAHPPSSPSLRPRATLVAIALLVLVHAIFFRAVLFEGMSFVSPDTIQVAKPAQEYTRRYHEHHHARPGWIPHVFAGMPARGSLMVLPTYPLHVPLRLLLGDAYGSDEAKVLHHVLAAVWTFVLVRMWGGGLPGAWLAGIGFSCATALVSVTAADHGGKLYTTSYLPLLLIVATKILKAPGLFWAGVGGIVVGAMLLAAHPQIAYYGFLAFGLFVLCSLRDIWREGGARRVLRVALYAIATVGVGYLVSAPLTLPAQEYAPSSIRGASASGGLDYEYATQWSFHPTEAATFLVPGFFGFGGSTYWGHMPFTDAPHYAGVVIVALAIVGASAMIRTARGAFLLAMMGLSLLVSMGKYSPGVYDLLFRVLPQFNRFRVPVLILTLFQLGVCVLAGIGVGALASAEPRRMKRWGMIMSGLAAVVLLLGMMGAQQARHVERPGEDRLSPAVRSAVAEERASVARGDTLRSALFLVIPGVLLVLTGRRDVRRRTSLVLSVGLALAGALDLCGVSARLVHPQYRKTDLERILRPTAAERWLAEQPGWFRVLPLGERANSNRLMVFDIESVMGYYPAKVARYARLLEAGGLQSLPVLRMLGTRYLLSPQPLQSGVLTLEKTFGADHIYSLPDPLPKAWCVSRWAIAAGDEALRLVVDPGFQPESLAVLESDPGVSQGGVGRVIALAHDRPERLEVRVEVDGGALLIVSDVYYAAGWRARVDGRPGTVLPANHVLCAVPLEAGSHTVEFFYESAAERMADRYALAGWCAAVAMMVGGAWRRARLVKRWASDVFKARGGSSPPDSRGH